MRKALFVSAATLTVIASCSGPAPEREPAPRETVGGEAAPGTVDTADEDYGEAPETATDYEEARAPSEPAAPPPPEPMVVLDAHLAELGVRREALEAALEMAEVDCDAAGQLRDRICVLAERICDISGRNRGDGEIRARCQDAEERCEEARNSVGERCPD